MSCGAYWDCDHKKAIEIAPYLRLRGDVDGFLVPQSMREDLTKAAVEVEDRKWRFFELGDGLWKVGAEENDDERTVR